MEAAISDLKSVLESEDVESIQSKTNGLAQVAMKLGEAAYKGQQQGPAVAMPVAPKQAGGRREGRRRGCGLHRS